jgi:NADPH:quinone reductase-like Zn-dependent oxidoreductase
MMKAAILRSADGVPEYGDFDEPAAGPDAEIVELVAAGIHHLTRSTATGRHYSRAAAFPVIPGLNAVARRASGELVFTAGGPPPYGTFAERMASPAGMRFPLPPDADPAAVAAGVNPGMGSWLPLTAHKARVGALGTVLILGITGTAGYLGAQNARLLGATGVVGAGRNEAGLARADALGVRTVPLTGDRQADARALAAALEAEQPDLVLDFVWGSVAETAFSTLGMLTPGQDSGAISYVQIGSLGGAEAAVPSALLRSRPVTISGSGAGSVPGAVIKERIGEYTALIADGSVRVPFRAFPLSDVAEAWAASARSGPRPVLIPG